MSETEIHALERDGYLRAKDAARAIGCGERWLREGANHHGFPHTRAQKRAMWFSPEDITEIRKLLHVPAQPAKMRRRRAAPAGVAAASRLTRAA